MNHQIKYALLIVFLLLLTVLLTACDGANVIEGSRGAPGVTTPVSSAPASLLQCPTGGTVVTVGTNDTVICNGGQGPAGVPGLNGNDGAVGPSGPQGRPGVDTTPITVVQFCPGVTVYPSAFLEVGFIINGELYAVYSINNGFLAQIPPGNYSSNAMGSACNFTVNPDLSISH